METSAEERQIQVSQLTHIPEQAHSAEYGVKS